MKVLTRPMFKPKSRMTENAIIFITTPYTPKSFKPKLLVNNGVNIINVKAFENWEKNVAPTLVR